ncbi:MAG TPA: amino acid--tRNA ligase-related protein, partial [Polyangia bacterium]|nr:amino acid--tRNA ligase-related protein [Polyangia bacterium]
MSDERELIAERERKVAELRAAGHNPYANGFRPTSTAGSIHDWFAGGADGAHPPQGTDKDGRLSVAGRIVAIRSFGKAAFAKLRDRTGEIQVWVKLDVVGEQTFALWKLVERGDFVGVEGLASLLTKTKAGEDTVVAERMHILTKATRPLPEKWHGLQDMEIRYRQRYLDLVSNPEVFEVFRKRTQIVRHLRRFLDQRDFIEVETPMMHTVLGGAAARPFRTHHNALALDLTMRIAPELHLKRLVVGGFDRVYEIGRNFRNEGLSRQHNPEFTMLEFYQAYATYEDLMVLTQQLLTELAHEICGGTQITYQGQTVDLGQWERIPMKDAIVAAVAAGKLPKGLERPMLDDEAALLRWLAGSGVLDGKDELSAVLPK